MQDVTPELITSIVSTSLDLDLWKIILQCQVKLRLELRNGMSPYRVPSGQGSHLEDEVTRTPLCLNKLYQTTGSFPKDVLQPT